MGSGSTETFISMTRWAGTQATLWKEAIQHEFKEQMEQGTTGLLREDYWMMEVTLGDMETTTGEQEEYWLVANKATREVAALPRQRASQTQEEPTADGHYFFSLL